ncbi:hypothetical protein CEUSTIGMA_g13098.t1 [Chlamydomonas eustigma]|uniref:WLM domain-containing protein n=1 Tax=Chlamydomonas eustigma TaxID=1157962 RepID=A0A250XRP7_9CHLO|nr:hypothetical protein CEUSTIGMA_g13098.t1 [Chlamydomonas eustigma]|eukprot:GAX85683.1 hypothetical protein CEUSTIGMA_g13098.t1 [Chlamydomonas eustigma]
MQVRGPAVHPGDAALRPHHLQRLCGGAPAAERLRRFVILVMVIILLTYIYKYYGEVTIVTASDGQRYVVRKLPDSQRAAEILAALNAKLTRLVRHMVASYPNDRSVEFLYANYNPAALSEGGTEVGYTSYAVNKGEKIVVCLRQKAGNGQKEDAFVDENVLTYVAIHELAHLMTEIVGHTTDFWDNFRRLAREAIAIGVYERIDFEAAPEPYCGIIISSSVV